ncbi:MAG: transposase [Nitrososphaerales archaeon]|jgi:hypothetical protein
MTFTDLTAEEWGVVRGLIPSRRGVGRPRAEDRRTLNAILLVLQGGIPWNYLPDEYGSDSTANRRLKEWEKDGTWDRIADALGLVEASEVLENPGLGDGEAGPGSLDGPRDCREPSRRQSFCPARVRITVAPEGASEGAVDEMRVLACSDGEDCRRRFESPGGTAATEFEAPWRLCFLFSGEEKALPELGGPDPIDEAIVATARTFLVSKQKSRTGLPRRARY